MYVVYLSVAEDGFIDKYSVTIIKDGKLEVSQNTSTKIEAFAIMSQEIPTTLPVNYECFTSDEFNQHN